MKNLLTDAAQDFWEKARTSVLGLPPRSPIDGTPMSPFVPAPPAGQPGPPIMRSAEGRSFLPLVEGLPFTKDAVARYKEQRRPGRELGDAVSGFMGGIGGPNAVGANLRGLSHAQDLARKGASKETILRGTGWWQDPVGNWKFEYSDAGMKLKTIPGAPPSVFSGGKPGLYLDDTFIPGQTWIRPLIGSVKDPATGKRVETVLSDIIDHPELFRQYPQLKKLYVAPEFSLGANGSFYEGGVTKSGVVVPPDLRMGSLKADKFPQTLVHEIQHAIQAIENTPRGGNPNLFPYPEVNKLAKSAANGYNIVEKLVQKYAPKGSLWEINHALERQKTPETRDFMIDFYKKKDAELFTKYPPHVIEAVKRWKFEQEALKQVKDLPYNKYRSIMGEQEAEAVAQRYLSGTSPNMRENPLWNYFTVPYDQQIVRGVK